MGFLRWGGLSIHSPLSTSTSSLPPSFFYYTGRDRDCPYFLWRLSAASVLYGETETLSDTYRKHVRSSSPRVLENYYLGTREIKVTQEKGFDDGLHSLLDNGAQISYNEDKLTYLTALQSTQASHFGLLIKNIDMLEDMCADSNSIKLERDILEQLEKLGASNLFYSCLSKSLESSSSFNLFDEPTELAEEANPRINESVGKVVVRSGKKELRKLRKRISPKQRGTSFQRVPLETVSKDPRPPEFTSVKRSKNRRKKIARNEAEMSSGVKLVAELEKIRKVLEEETGQRVSLSSWAEATGMEMKELQKQLHYGWHCRDELLRSTRSLVLFVARNYRGLGVAFEDLIQAGNFGVLQGAERFDRSRGYKFSTYVQYWIRKSISKLVANHGRLIRIPSTLTNAINQVHRARKALRTSNGKNPDDSEIAKFTGLSIAKIISARKCLRVVGSIDQKIWDGINIKFSETTPDTSVTSSEDIVNRQHMIKDMSILLDGLNSREKQVLILRFGLGNQQCRSLEEIGRYFSVSKEWIRKIEKTALTKLRDENAIKILSYYVHKL